MSAENNKKQKIPAFMEIFSKIKPKIELGTAMLSIMVTEGPCINRFIILFSLIGNLVNIICAVSFAISDFDGHLTANYIKCLLFLSGYLQIAMKVLSTFIQRKRLVPILEWSQSLHTNKDVDESTKEIIEENLFQFMKICFYIYKTMLIILVSFCALSYILSLFADGDGILYWYQFLVSSNLVYVPLAPVMQAILLGCPCCTSLYIDLCILFIGLEIMAALNILNQMIIAEEMSIEKSCNFLKIIAKRHCEVVTIINEFNSYTSILFLMHFATTTPVLLLSFTSIQLNTNDFLGYLIIAFAWGELLLLCLFGEFIKIKTEILSQTLYLTNWYDMSVKDQKTYLLILRMMQRTSGLKAAGMYDINMNTFVQLTKAIISYCGLILTLSEQTNKKY
uniref:Odorant receptor n=1 Tax=Lutzomyia longipalpis TaxID=7200 RepID=A0A3F2ZDE1_LUTLO